MKQMLLIVLHASAQEMHILPKGARPQNWKEVKAALTPLELGAVVTPVMERCDQFLDKVFSTGK